MNSIKCIECGLVNFASATECKRCHVKFHRPEDIANAVAEFSETAENSEVPTEPFENGQSQVRLAPLPEYFDAEPGKSLNTSSQCVAEDCGNLAPSLCDNEPSLAAMTVFRAPDD